MQVVTHQRHRRPGNILGNLREEKRASSNMVGDEGAIRFLLSKVFNGIGPQNIAHQTLCWWVTKTINLQASLLPCVMTKRMERATRLTLRRSSIV
jgi:hypothetical protein